ncbi:zinc-binding metallopeptidase [Chitinophaga nivalis]|uniref:Zinc-binding metallopeptidase n=1 Tax=Chitinophaga nivalis TaxID=2991709 RepID=A0ABT3IFG7_9BACT|nr:putative zinc-binding metallopeptidase [Chitinophaga nivalis]MCW3467603.1 putative zinc-binding metallopeptidase [Chitinophaga nivalis]MCW3482705.1 putative zinc-binding metallopeptidase [Chitinophaga nivalis]
MKYFLRVITLCLLVACSKQDNLGDVEDIPGLGGDTWVKGPLDKWLYDSLTVPYNIAVKYKWDQFEFELDKTLVPPKESQVIPVMKAVKKVWMDTYIAAAGELFFKRYCPKFFILSGSASWNENGTITLGTAEGGRKVVLYLVNDFRTKDMEGYQPEDAARVKQVFRVIEHEFAHILHQQIMYPVTFRQISKGLYTANWNNISNAKANRDGFVTAYAMASYDEDFAEMIATMLVEGRDGFDRIVNSIPPGFSANGISQAEARSRLRAKEAQVVSYYQTIWQMDFYRLQARTRNEIVRLLY